MSQPVPGWAPVDEDARLDPARRPIAQILREVVAVYRGEARPLLVLAAMFEGSIALLSLPYLIITVELGLRMLDLMGRLLEAPAAFGRPSAFSTAFDQFREPGVAAYGGVVGVAPLASIVLLGGAVAALLAADRDGRSATAAARSVLRRWAVLVLPIAVLAILAAALSVWSATATANMLDEPIVGTYPRWFGPYIALSLLVPVILVGAVYLAVRWAVAIPALVVEGIGLRAALARSSALTARRRLHVALCVLTVGAIWSILSWIAVVPFYLATTALLGFGGGPLLAAPLALYVIGRVVLAPLLPILGAILYRDFQATGPAAPGRPAEGPAAPPGWGIDQLTLAAA